MIAYSQKVEDMACVTQEVHHGAAPIPEEGKWVKSKNVQDISGLTHGVGWCAPQQGACKLTLNVKDGIIQECLVETIGCSGMTHSAAMAAEILPGLTVLGAGLDDLGKGLRSQVGTLYGTLKKGPRYLELAEGYVTKLGLDKEGRIIGYEVVQVGKVLEAVRKGKDANEAIKANTSTKGRFADAVKTIDPREE